MSSYNEQMQALANDYQFATGNVTFTLKDVGVWAIKEGKWEAGHDAILRQFCDDMGRALREEYIRDPQGRRVRAKHAIRGEGETGFLWADIHNGEPSRRSPMACSTTRLATVVKSCAVPSRFGFRFDLGMLERLGMAHSGTNDTMPRGQPISN